MELTEIRDRLKQAMDLIEPIPEAMTPLVHDQITDAFNALDEAFVSVRNDVKWSEDLQRAWDESVADADDPDEAGPGMRAKVVS